MTCTTEHMAAQAAERLAWKALEQARDILQGKRRSEENVPLGPLDEDMRQWAARLLPSLEANWRKAHTAANPKGQPGGRHFAPARFKR